MKIFILILSLCASQAFAKAQHKYSVSGFEHAVFDNDLKAAKRQIKLKVPVDGAIDVDDAPTSSLIVAIRDGHFEMYKLLVENGANPNGLKDGYLPMNTALEGNRQEIAMDLLSRKLDFSLQPQGLTPMMMAAKTCNEDVLKGILEQDHEVNRKNKVGKTALFYAADAGCLVAAKMLMAQLADSKIKDESGKRAVDYLGEVADKKDLKALLK